MWYEDVISMINNSRVGWLMSSASGSMFLLSAPAALRSKDVWLNVFIVITIDWMCSSSSPPSLTAWGWWWVCRMELRMEGGGGGGTCPVMYYCEIAMFLLSRRTSAANHLVSSSADSTNDYFSLLLFILLFSSPLQLLSIYLSAYYPYHNTTPVDEIDWRIDRLQKRVNLIDNDTSSVWRSVLLLSSLCGNYYSHDGYYNEENSNNCNNEKNENGGRLFRSLLWISKMMRRRGLFDPVIADNE